MKKQKTYISRYGDIASVNNQGRVQFPAKYRKIMDIYEGDSLIVTSCTPDEICLRKIPLPEKQRHFSKAEFLSYLPYPPQLNSRDWEVIERLYNLHPIAKGEGGHSALADMFLHGGMRVLKDMAVRTEDVAICQAEIDTVKAQIAELQQREAKLKYRLEQYQSGHYEKINLDF